MTSLLGRSTKFWALAVSSVLALGSPCVIHAEEQEEDGGFHSLAEYLRVEGPYYSVRLLENADDVFDTKDIAKRLVSERRVRLFRRLSDSAELIMVYDDLSRKSPLKDRLGKQISTVEVPESAFRPVLDLASDFSNYGPETMCGFHPDVALFFGGDEPEYILICCFTCHDMQVIRRPTMEHPMPQTAMVGMSPELERAIFDLAKASYPNDKTLQDFKLAGRKRSKTPLKKLDYKSGPSDDPFAPKPKAKPDIRVEIANV